MSTKLADSGRIAHTAEADGASAHSGPQSPQAAPPTDSKRAAARRRRRIGNRPGVLIGALAVAVVAIGVGWWWHAYGAAGGPNSPMPNGGGPGRGGGSQSASPGQGGPGQPRPLLVEVEPVRRGEIAATLALSGEVVAADSVVIAATKEGPVTYCPWREGDSVKAGEKLIEIDREVHRAEVEAAEAAVRIARAKLADLEAGARPEELHKAEANVRRWQATLDEARRNLERQQRLLEKRATSQQALDQAQERVEVAASELASVQETLRMLRAGPTPTELAVQSSAVDEAAARLALAQRDLPADIDPPLVMKADPSQLPVLQLTAGSDRWDLVELREWADHWLQDRILAVRGVAGTEIIGGLEREVRILLDFNRVFILQSALAQEQDQLARASGDAARSLIEVYRALGGGWQIRYTE